MRIEDEMGNEFTVYPSLGGSRIFIDSPGGASCFEFNLDQVDDIISELSALVSDGRRKQREDYHEVD